MIVKHTEDGHILVLKLKDLDTNEVRDPSDEELFEIEDVMLEKRKLREERKRIN